MSLFNRNNKNLALVLAGGGGKGAYQVGAFKALIDLDIYNKVNAISATSVGALNACFFIQNKVDTLNYLWLNEVSDKILTTHSDNIFDMIKASIAEGDSTEKLKDNIFSFSQNGIFSRDGITEIIDKYIDFKYISKSKIDFYACAVSIAKLEVKYFNIKKIKKEAMKDVLLATSSLPVIFGTEDVEGEKYIDGGLPFYGDNAPIRPVYDAGYKNIIVIHLLDIDIVKEEDYPNANIYQVYNKTGLGSIFSGILDFSESTANKKISAGYKDTINKLLGLRFD